jgi:hypothetical protein
VERAAKALQARYGMESTVPSRMIQETGGWAQPRREAGGDSEYTAAMKAEAAESRPPVNNSQFHQETLF